MHTVAGTGVAEVEALAPSPSDLVDAFLASVERRGAGPALRAGAEGEWISWERWRADSERAARAFAALGVRRGDRVALMLRNRPEFHILDMALLMLGAIPFSIYNTSSPPQIAELLTDSGARLVVAEADLAVRVVASGVGGLPVFSIDDAVSGVPAWSELLDAGLPRVDLPGLRASTSIDDVATIIYTSGTTGPPKGVQLTHGNLIWMARILPVWWRLDPDAQSLVSYLPMAHVAERIFTYYMPVVWGFPVTSCHDPRAVGTMLPPVQPSIFFAPPRFWEKLRAAALAGPLAPAELQTALERGLEIVRAQQAGEPAPSDADEVAAAFAPMRTAFGLGGLQTAMISAASVPPPLVEFWRAVGVPLVEGYGLSEASAGVCFDTIDAPRIGTVGPPLPGVEVRLGDDGELLVRSPSVMAGYRNLPEQTAEALDDDGWLHTGDVATIDDDGRVRIVDRKKELIINSAGKNMSPTNIEGELKSASPLIGQAICIGEARPYNVALLVLDPETAGMPVARAAADPAIRARVEEAVEQANANLSRVEQIKRYEILDVDWLPDSDELTPTMKLKRKPIAAKYAAIIESLYASS
jgi:long-chain acyl-CoA synthetase